jgi:iron complex outermembrane receptor protein
MQSFTNYTDPCDINFGLTGNSVVQQRCLNGFANLPAVGPGFTQLNTNGVPVSGPNTTSTTPFYTGANPNLKPETSKNFTAGIVYSPSWFTGFNITADFYRIRVDNVITLPSADSILDNCYLLGEAQQCSAVLALCDEWSDRSTCCRRWLTKVSWMSTAPICR